MEESKNTWVKVNYLNLDADNNKYDYYVRKLPCDGYICGGFEYILDMYIKNTKGTKEEKRIRKGCLPVTKDEIEFLD